MGKLQGLPWPSLAYMGLGTTALTLWIEMSALKQACTTTVRPLAGIDSWMRAAASQEQHALSSIYIDVHVMLCNRQEAWLPA